MISGFEPGNPDSVSIHYVIDIDGYITKMVDEREVANHANSSLWQRLRDINDISIGIEIVHSNTSAKSRGKFQGQDNSARARRFTEEQYAALVPLVRRLVDKYQIAPSRVVSHADVNYQFDAMAIEPRGDPGDTFEWSRLGDMTLRPRPYDGGDPEVEALYARTLPLTPTPAQGDANRKAHIILVKKLLENIGYGVTKVTPNPQMRAPSSQRTRHYQPIQFNATFDGAFQRAIEAFQQRHFSGPERRYHYPQKLFSPKPVPEAGDTPAIGTLDVRTIKAIVEVWHDKQVRG